LRPAGRNLCAPQGCPLTVGAGAAWQLLVSRAAQEWISPLGLAGSHRRRLSGQDTGATRLLHRLLRAHHSMPLHWRQSGLGAGVRGNTGGIRAVQPAAEATGWRRGRR